VKDRPTRLGDELQKYLQDSGLDERMEATFAVPEWAERVGPSIAAVTVPLRVNRGTLLVAVNTSAWLMELRLMEREILRRLNEGRQKGRIERVRFLMAGDDPDAPGAGEDTSRGRRAPGGGGGGRGGYRGGTGGPAKRPGGRNREP
jgi:predicted nucleic acid-binding Zn ribbon protein